MGFPRRDPRPRLRARQPAAESGIDRPVRPVRRRAGAFDLRPDLRPGAEAGIDRPHPVECLERPDVIVHMLGLAPDSGLPAEAEPFEVLVDRRFVFRPAAARVDILDAQQETAALPGERLREERRIGVSEVQQPRRARREAGDGAGLSVFCHDRGSMP